MSPSGKISEAMVEACTWLEALVAEALPGAEASTHEVVITITKLKAAIAALSVPAPGTDKWLGELLAIIHRDGGQYQATHGVEKAVEDAHSILAAAFSTPQAGDMGAVKVRDLEWEAVSQVEARAPGGFGDDYICYRSGAQVCLDLPDGKTTIHTSFEAAKAAAQQDYGSRVLSALSSTPVGEMDGWQTMGSAPHACHVLATRFDSEFGEWVFAVVMSPPSPPFTHWRPLPASPQGGR
ncbi:hypothetical protein [Mesorhizobium sp. NZP2298]|uniref:hypothetical protein n=1 Tax=Mesorhizobium sp. NZP2298 TaxID=2483403 RepID=UPI001555DB58|nr:hypothetical protein [Mesorhizobium sp. NZP2298]QKC99225.1 hypothetical protein EB231_35145 [Mesorhizobium sp. NZP2298]